MVDAKPDYGPGGNIWDVLADVTDDPECQRICELGAMLGLSEAIEIVKRRRQLIEEATRRFGPPPPAILNVLDAIISGDQLRHMITGAMPNAHDWASMVAGLISWSRFDPSGPMRV